MGGPMAVRTYFLNIMMALFLSPYLANADFSQEFLDFLDASHISSTKVDTNNNTTFDCSDFDGYQDPLTLTQDQYLYKTIFIDDRGEDEQQEITFECINKKETTRSTAPKILGYWPSDKNFSCEEALFTSGHEGTPFVWFDRKTYNHIYTDEWGNDFERIASLIESSDSLSNGSQGCSNGNIFKDVCLAQYSFVDYDYINKQSNPFTIHLSLEKSLANITTKTPLTNLSFTADRTSMPASNPSYFTSACDIPRELPLIHITHQGRKNVRLHELMDVDAFSSLINTSIPKFIEQYKNNDPNVNANARQLAKEHTTFQILFPGEGENPAYIGNVTLKNNKTGIELPGRHTNSISSIFYFDTFFEPDTQYTITVSEAYNYAKKYHYEGTTQNCSPFCRPSTTSIYMIFWYGDESSFSCTPDPRQKDLSSGEYWSSTCHKIGLSSQKEITFKTARENEFYSLNIGDPEATAVSP